MTPFRVSSLNRKLLRDIWHLRGQALAIAAVVAAGTAVFVMMNGVERSLERSREAYYESHRFADLFAPVKRAPEHLRARIGEMPGVVAVETRIIGRALIDAPDEPAPITATVVSLPDGRRPRVNDLYLTAGRWVEPDNPDEAILSGDFPRHHGLALGDKLRVTLNGVRRALTIVGTALSPEFSYPIPPGEIVPDERRFAVIWMSRRALANAYDLDGAFNEVVLRSARTADLDGLIGKLDRLLDGFGATGAYDRDEQTSNRFLDNEIEQLRTLGRLVPFIFFTVSAFLLNVAIQRTVETDREQIGLLKAFGYTDRDVAWQYVKLALAISAIGLAVGWLTGTMMGRGLAGIYTDFFKFPSLIFQPGPAVYAVSAIIAGVAASAGAVAGARASLRLSPAEAMRPARPVAYRRSRLPGGLPVDQATRLVLRHLGRWPRRALIAALGISLAMGIRVAAQQTWDAVDHILWVNFDLAQRYDLSVGFVDVRPLRALADLRALPGVRAVEGVRTVPARLRAGHRVERLGIIGHPTDARLSHVLDGDLAEVAVPPHGLVLSDWLSRRLGVGAGDRLSVEFTEGRRPTLELPVVSVMKSFIGAPAYMDWSALNGAMLDAPVVSGAYLRVDAAQKGRLLAVLKRAPEIATVTLKDEARDALRGKMDEFLGLMTLFNTLFSSLIAFGVIYNAARIAYSERARELATLRVLGFGTLEVCYVLLGEFAVLTLVALPVGSLIGWGLAAFITNALSSELFQIPLVIQPMTIGIAALTVVGAAIISAVLVGRQVAGQDVVSVLKSRD